MYIRRYYLSLINYDLLCFLAIGAYFVNDDMYNSVEKDGKEDG